MTIAIVHEIFFPITNGVLTSSIALGRALQRRGHRVVFIAPGWKAFLDSKVAGIPVEYVPSIPAGIYRGIRLTWPFSRRVAAMLQRREVDVLHLTAQGTLSWSCLRAARRLGLPVVSSLHTLIFEREYVRYAGRLLGPFNTDSFIRRLQRLAWGLVRWFLQHSDIVTAPSRYACRLIEKNCPGVEPLHLPNCVSLEVFSGSRDSGRSKTGGTSGILFADESGKVPPAKKTFVYVGRLGKEKSVDVLLEGFFRAWQKDRQLRLVVVGDGPEAGVYRRQAARSDGAVRFTGRLAHRELLQSGLLQRARALVTASTTENQPVSVLEAIGLGRPVIVPDVEGISELVEGNGSLFPAGDAAALAGELLRLAGDDEFFEGCAAQAQTLARAGWYAADSLAERYERICLGLELGVGIEGAGPADGVEYGQGRKLHELQC
ncbi:MAG: glycosyltransferase [Spirochaetota bacterium]